eukprot:Selendium_serpulae@DN3226_c0_g1_i2.p1
MNVSAERKNLARILSRLEKSIHSVTQSSQPSIVQRQSWIRSFSESGSGGGASKCGRLSLGRAAAVDSESNSCSKLKYSVHLPDKKLTILAIACIRVALDFLVTTFTAPTLNTKCASPFTTPVGRRCAAGQHLALARRLLERQQTFCP